MKKLILIMVLGMFLSGSLIPGTVTGPDGKKVTVNTVKELSDVLRKYAKPFLGDGMSRAGFIFIVEGTYDEMKALGKDPVSFNYNIDANTKFYSNTLKTLNSKEMRERLKTAKSSLYVVYFNVIRNKVMYIVDTTGDQIYPEEFIDDY